jgi:hypothetical protein
VLAYWKTDVKKLNNCTIANGILHHRLSLYTGLQRNEEYSKLMTAPLAYLRQCLLTGGPQILILVGFIYKKGKVVPVLS